MTKTQAKEVIELMFKGKTVLPKDDVLKVIDMIDDAGYIKTIEYPIVYPSYPYHPTRWWESWTCSDSNINLCTTTCTNSEAQLSVM